MMRPHRLLALLLFAGSVSRSKKITGPDADGWVELTGPGGRPPNSLAVIGTSLFATTSGGVFRSTDNAATWTPLTPNGVPVSSLVVNGTSLFWVTYNQSSYGLLRSTDSGVSWVPVNNGLPPVFWGPVVCGTSLFVAGNGADGSPGNVFRSTDDGASSDRPCRLRRQFDWSWTVCFAATAAEVVEAQPTRGVGSATGIRTPV